MSRPLLSMLRKRHRSKIQPLSKRDQRELDLLRARREAKEQPPAEENRR